MEENAVVSKIVSAIGTTSVRSYDQLSSRRICCTLTMANSGSMLGSTPNSKLLPPPPLPDGPAPESPPSSCNTGEDRMISERS